MSEEQYAIFGLQSDVGLRQVRRRYRALVKRWHPDRYTTDIVGQKDASERMRQINVAYVTLVRFLQPDNKRLELESSLTSKRCHRPIASRKKKSMAWFMLLVSKGQWIGSFAA